MTKRSTALTALAATGAAALLLAGCTAPGQDTAAPGGSGDADKTITVAVFNGWDEGIAASELWKHVLEDKGYTVNLEYAEPAAVYTGLANGDYDVTLDTWLPTTHEDYVARFGDQLTDLGAWNDESKLTIAVNADAPIDSLDELAANAELFGNRIVGIDAGAGLTRATREDIIPGYGLEGMEFIESSTPAMLTELRSATDAGQNIAVTLWRPHWAYNAFPIKDLEDPQGLFGATEKIHTYANAGFEAEFPEVAGWLREFRMDNETLYALENAMFNENTGDDYGPVVADWASQNQEWVDGLTS